MDEKKVDDAHDCNDRTYSVQMISKSRPIWLSRDEFDVTTLRRIHYLPCLLLRSLTR